MVLTIIGSPTCPFCQGAKEFMKKNNIEFKELDIDSGEGKRIADENNLDAIPIIFNECNETVVGFHEKAILELAKGKCKV